MIGSWILFYHKEILDWISRVLGHGLHVFFCTLLLK